ncbi:MAG: ABC transporter ATP-binding protein, partial [Clostridium sp.]
MSKNKMEIDEKVTSRSKSELIKRLFAYLKPYKLKATIIVFLMIFVILCSIINPYLLKVAIDNNVANNNIKGLILMGGILIIINLASWGVSRLRWIMISDVTNNILVNIRHELYCHIQELSFDFFDNRPVGKILARVVGDVNTLKNLFDQSIQSLIPELLNLVFVAIVMLVLNVKLALACIMLLPVLGISMFIIETFSRRRWEVYRNKRSNLNAFTHEEFSGIKVVQSFAKEDYTEEKFEDLVLEQKKVFNRAVRLNDMFWPLVELSWGIGTVIVFAIGYKLIISGEIQVGTLIAFSMYTGMFWRPIM